MDSIKIFFYTEVIKMPLYHIIGNALLICQITIYANHPVSSGKGFEIQSEYVINYTASPWII